MLLNLFALILSPFAGRLAGSLALRISDAAEPGQTTLDGQSRRMIPSGRWPLTELAAVSLTIWIVFLTDDAIAILSCGLMLWLLCLSLVDIRTYLLPDVMTLPLIPAGLLVAFLLSPESLSAHAIGAVLGWGIFALVGLFFVKFRGQIGLGGGDAKLLAGAGAWLGWEALPSVIVIAAIAGLVYAGALMLSGKSVHRGTPIPFGPFLAIAFLGVWLHGPLLLI